MKEISAGGVVFRMVGDTLEIQMIQDRYGKITLAKGKMEAGETVEETALREIMEETGIIGEIIEPLEIVSYQYEHPEKGVMDKEVHYYLVKQITGELRAQVEEISGVEWLLPQAAWEHQRKLGYANNNSVVKKALQKLGFEAES